MSVPPINPKSGDNNKLDESGGSIAIAQKRQMLFIETDTEKNGIGMGVLSDGTAYLHGRGLARLCDVSNARIVELGQVWGEKSKNAMAEGVKHSIFTVCATIMLTTLNPCLESATSPRHGSSIWPCGSAPDTSICPPQRPMVWIGTGRPGTPGGYRGNYRKKRRFRN